MSRKKAEDRNESRERVVNYSFGQQTYQIDPESHKVYRRFVEIETARASTIFASWRSTHVEL